MTHTAIETDINSCTGVRIRNRIVTHATCQGVGTGTTDQCVVARACAEQVVFGITCELVVFGRADKGFDATELVALGIATAAAARHQADADAAG